MAHQVKVSPGLLDPADTITLSSFTMATLSSSTMATLVKGEGKGVGEPSEAQGS